MSDATVDLTADPAAVVEKLAALSEQQQEALLRAPSGDAVLDELFRQMRDRFEPDTAKDEEALARFVLTGGPGGSTRVYALRISGGACALTTGDAAVGEPADEGRTVTVTTDRVRMVRIVTGQANAAKAYLMRKIKIDGDLRFGGKVMSWFGVPEQD